MKNLFYLLFLALFISCSSNETSNTSEEVENKPSDKKSITLTQEQITIAEIKTEKIEKHQISETIECSGNIEIPPANIATVSPIMDGFVKKLNFFPGNVIHKGDVLATLQHPEFINLQQRYIEAKSQVDYYQEEFKRQGELTVENAASIKKMQRAKAEYLSYEATYKSLKSQLELLGINPENIEKGDFIKEFKLFAPIDGIVSQLNANAGKFVSSENLMYEIINPGTLNLHLNVFEKDISRINSGQKIVFWTLNNDQKFKSYVKRIGIKINDNNHTTLVHGVFENKNQQLKAGMFIKALIYINERESYTLPSEAVIKFHNEPHLIVKNATEFSLIKIETGIEQNNMIEIKEVDEEILRSEIVVKGAYYLTSIIETEDE